MDKDLATYLNDHLAGSVVAIELLKRFVEQNQSNGYAKPAQKLLQEISEDQEILKRLIERLGFSQSFVKKASTWLLEKIRRPKMNQAFVKYSGFSRFLDLESLYVGVNGKLNLWKVLDKIFGKHAHFSDFNFRMLGERSMRQCEEVQALALKAADLAFKNPAQRKS